MQVIGLTHRPAGFNGRRWYFVSAKGPLRPPILGMIPIAPTVFWGPMAYSIMGGLAVATVLTLVFLPALYVAWFRIKEASPQQSEQTVGPMQHLLLHLGILFPSGA
jgi:hypothetical protein